MFKLNSNCEWNFFSKFAGLGAKNKTHFLQKMTTSTAAKCSGERSKLTFTCKTGYYKLPNSWQPAILLYLHLCRLFSWIYIYRSDGFRGVRKGRTHPLNFEQQNVFMQFLLITSWTTSIASMYCWPLPLLVFTHSPLLPPFAFL